MGRASYAPRCNIFSICHFRHMIVQLLKMRSKNGGWVSPLRHNVLSSIMSTDEQTITNKIKAMTLASLTEFLSTTYQLPTDDLSEKLGEWEPPVPKAKTAKAKAAKTTEPKVTPAKATKTKEVAPKASKAKSVKVVEPEPVEEEVVEAEGGEEEENPICAYTINGKDGARPCDLRGKFELDGKWYCGTAEKGHYKSALAAVKKTPAKSKTATSKTAKTTSTKTTSAKTTSAKTVAPKAKEAPAKSAKASALISKVVKQQQVNLIEVGGYYIEPGSRVIIDCNTQEATGHLDDDNETVLPLTEDDASFCETHNIIIRPPPAKVAKSKAKTTKTKEVPAKATTAKTTKAKEVAPKTTKAKAPVPKTQAKKTKAAPVEEAPDVEEEVGDVVEEAVEDEVVEEVPEEGEAAEEVPNVEEGEDDGANDIEGEEGEEAAEAEEEAADEEEGEDGGEE